jgi:hypothetical protein
MTGLDPKNPPGGGKKRPEKELKWDVEGAAFQKDV